MNKDENETSEDATARLRKELFSFHIPHKSEENTYYGTAPIGTLPFSASPYGAIDMTSNVGEWTGTRLNHYNCLNPDDEDPREIARAIRGDYSFIKTKAMRTSYRYRMESYERHVDIGFRCAWDGE